MQLCLQKPLHAMHPKIVLLEHYISAHPAEAANAPGASCLTQTISSSHTWLLCIAHFGMHAGHGETDDGFHSTFKSAWEAHPDAPVPIFGSGQNIIPTIHIADLAAYVAAVCIKPPAQQYLLAIDNAQLSQRDIVSAIAARMGNTPVKEQTLEELYFQQVSFLQSHTNSTWTSIGISALGTVLMLR